MRTDVGRWQHYASAFDADPGTSSPGRDWKEADTQDVFGMTSPQYSAFLATDARSSYDDGLWRLLLPDGAPSLSMFNSPAGWTSDWPDMRGLTAFGYDWLGRRYVVDSDGTWTKRGTIVRFSPATGDVEAPTAEPTRLDDYLFDLLPRHKRDWLSADYFHDWQRAGGRPLRPNECVGYTVPLLLGGVDDVPNLEISDLMVYLSVSGQTYRQVSRLPDETAIDSVKFET